MRRDPDPDLFLDDDGRVRYGIAPDALSNQYEIRGNTVNMALLLMSLNRTPNYWFAVDAFNENGLTAWVGPPVTAPAP